MLGFGVWGGGLVLRVQGSGFRVSGKSHWGTPNPRTLNPEPNRR